MIRISIFDMDGTLVDHDWRLPMIISQGAMNPNMKLPQGANRFSLYHDNIKNDTNTIPAGLAALRRAVKDGDAIYFSTARPETHRKVTEAQILELLGLHPASYGLMMRQSNQEGVKSEVLKVEHLKHIEALERNQGATDDNVESVEFYDDHLGVVSVMHTAEMFGRRTLKAYLVGKFGLFRSGIAINLQSGDSDDIVKAKVKYHSATGALIGETTGHRLLDECSEENGVMINLKCGWVDTTHHRMDMTSEGWDEFKGVCLRLGANVFTSPNPNWDHARGGKEKPSANTTTETFSIKPEAAQWQRPPALEVSLSFHQGAAEVLDEMASLFRERNANYKDNAVVVARVMQALFPNGVDLRTPNDYHVWHLFELMVVKLTRFTNSGLRHEDSIKDLAVYAAMVTPLINEHDITIKE